MTLSPTQAAIMARFINEARTGRPSSSNRAFMLGSPVYIETLAELAMEESGRLAREQQGTRRS